MVRNEHGKLPDTLVSQTGGGGKHVFFKRPEGGVKNSAGKIAKGIDVRCDNGYVVIPPSPHHSGGEYCWLDDEPEDIQIAEAPEWILGLARGQQAEVIPINRNQPQPIPRQGWRGNSNVLEGQRNESMISYIGFLIQQGGRIQRIFEKANRANRRYCIPPLPDSEVQKMLTSAIERWTPAEAQQTGVIRPLSFYHKHKYRSEHFAKHYKKTVSYVPEQGMWSAWDGTYWDMKPETEVTHVVGEVMNFNDDLWDATSDMQPPLKQQWENWAKSCSNSTNINAVIKLARSIMLRSFSEYNKDDYALNCANGVIDLRTGKIEEHKPEFFITQKTDVNLDPNGSCPNFLHFLDTIMGWNQEMIDYLQKLVGYCLTGSISERAIFIFYGHGRNGKSTFLRVLQDLMGDYIKQQTTKVFMERQNDGVRNDLAGLHDCRLVTTSEIGKHNVLDAPMIKEFTGGDPISCRFLYKESFTYIPKFKLIMAVNDRPNLSVKDSAIWARVKMIPFEVKIPDDKIVAQEQLLELYHLEMPKILDWAVQGAKKWIEEGLGDPPSVVQATKDYQYEIDPNALWIETRHTSDEKDCVPYAELYGDYKVWADENQIGLPVDFDAKVFGRTVMRKWRSKNKKVVGKTVKHYFGFKLPKSVT